MLCLSACGRIQTFCRAKQTNAQQLLHVCLSDTNPQGGIGEDIHRSIFYGDGKQEVG